MKKSILTDGTLSWYILYSTPLKLYIYVYQGVSIGIQHRMLEKCWLDAERRPLTQKGDSSFVAKCPWRIGIVSTGLIVNGDDEGERGALAKKSFGVVILDEAHKARASREKFRGVAVSEVAQEVRL